MQVVTTIKKIAPKMLPRIIAVLFDGGVIESFSELEYEFSLKHCANCVE